MKRKLIAAAPILLVALLSSACVKHISTLRDAQQIFNRSAEADNRQNLNPTAAPLVDDASTGYAIAQKMLGDLIAKNRKDLQQDRLLCTALALRAMSLWRLHQYTEADKLATEDPDAQMCAMNSAQAPRDVALLQAIPALIRIDEANQVYVEDLRKLQAMDPSSVTNAYFDGQMSRYQDIQTKIYGASGGPGGNKGALCSLQKASRSVGDNPVQTYLGMSMLAGLRIVNASVEVDLAPAQRNAENTRIRKDAAIVLISLRRILGLEQPTQSPTDATAREALNGWGQLFGITAASTSLEEARKETMNFCR